MESFCFSQQSLFTVIAANLAMAPPRMELPAEWQDIYTPKPQWQVVCDDPAVNGDSAAECKSHSLIYFQSDSGTPAGTDLIVRFEPFGSWRYYLQVAPYQGRCVGGDVSIRGPEPFHIAGLTMETIDVELAPMTHDCQPKGGHPFLARDKTRRANARHVEWLEKGGEMRIDLHLANGNTISRTVPLGEFSNDFKRLLEFWQAKAKENRGGRRRR